MLEMKKIGTSSARFALLGVALFVLAACGGSGSADPSTSNGGSTAKLDGKLPTGKAAPPGQEIAVASPYAPLTLDPQFSTEPGLNSVTWRINEGLTIRNPDGKFVPALASEMPRQIDPTTWEIKLVEGATFSDGTPFDADAAIFSFERILDPKYATGVPEAKTVKKVEKVDDHTIRVQTTEPDLAFVNKLHTIKMVDPRNPKIDSKPIGTGPYMLQRYSPGSSAVLVANPKYRGKQPQIDKVTLKFIPDAGTRIQALQAGEVDLVPSVSPNEIGQLEHYVPTETPAWSGFVKLNAHDGLLSDKRVREALNYAVDKESIVKGLFGGSAVASTCQFHGSEPYAAPDLKPWPYDPAKAKALVKDAGATGKALTIDWSTGLWMLDRQVGELVQEQLKATGLNASIRFNPPEAHLQRVYEAGAKAGQAQFTAVSDSLGDASRSIGLFLPSDGPISIYANKGLDAKIAKAKVEPDAKARSAAYREIMADACDQAAVLYLFEWDDIYGLSDRLTWKPSSNSGGGRWFYDEMTVIEPGA